MKVDQILDLALKELSTTMQPSLSIRRILAKRSLTASDDNIEKAEDVLLAKSLAKQLGTGSTGNSLYAITETGLDFIRSYGSYAKFMKGSERESKKVERARKKKPFKASKHVDGDPVVIYTPPNNMKKMKGLRKLAIYLLIAVLIFLAYELLYLEL